MLVTVNNYIYKKWIVMLYTSRLWCETRNVTYTSPMLLMIWNRKTADENSSFCVADQGISCFFLFYDQIKTLFHKFNIFATARGFQSTPLHLERSGLKTRGLISREAWCKATPMNHDINHDIMIHYFVYCWLVIVLQLYGWEQTVIFTWTSLQPAAMLLYTELPMFISTSQV